MKKLTTRITGLILLLSLCGCTAENVSQKHEKIDEEFDFDVSVSESENNADESGINENDANESDAAEEGKKISGTITACSDFSEGKAFVKTADNDNVTYCIDKSGRVLFEIRERVDTGLGEIISTEFKNSIAIVNLGSTTNFLCTSTGEIIHPEDLGVTEFYGIALESGYIIATQIGATYNSTSKKAGVLNTDLEWIVELNEDFYKNISDEKGRVFIPFETYGAYGGGTFCSGNILYMIDTKQYVDLNTGKILDIEDVSISVPSSAWDYEWTLYDCQYVDTIGNVMLDLNYENMNSLDQFNNGFAAIKFHNRDAGKYYFSLINESGKLAFEPIVIDLADNGWGYNIQTDGNTVIISQNSGTNAKSYDINGNFIASIDLESLDGKNRSYKLRLSDGVIIVTSSYSLGDYKCHLFTPDFTPIISEEA